MSFFLSVLITFGRTTSVISQGVSLILSGITIACATVLISLRITLVTRKRFTRYSYTRIIDILVQSAALETVVLILNAIATFVSATQFKSNPDNDSAIAILAVQVLGYASSCRVVVMVCIHICSQSTAAADTRTKRGLHHSYRIPRGRRGPYIKGGHYASYTDAFQRQTFGSWSWY